MTPQAQALAAIVKDRAGHEPVRLGLILGSGLGHIADQVEGTAISYSDLDRRLRSLEDRVERLESSSARPQ